MAIVSIKEASNLVGKSIPTIYRHITEGKISKTETGIDTSELLRFYGAFKSTTTDETLKSASQFNPEIALLKQEIEFLRREVLDLRNDKDRLFKVIEEVRLLPSPSPEKQGFFKKIFS